MNMKIAGVAAATAAVCAVALAGPVLAGTPVGGIGVSVESSPGGIMMTPDQCAQKGGKITKHTNGKYYCDLPQRQTQSAPITKPTTTSTHN